MLSIMTVPLTQGLFALVDGEDYEKLDQYKWRAMKTGNTYVAARRNRNSGGVIYMHREIMSPPRGMQVDHAKGCGLDNRKQNLRICMSQENTWNQRPRKDVSSQYKGVCWHKASCKWQTYISRDGERIYLGLFTSETEAAEVYNAAAQELFGEFASLNIIGKGCC